MRVPLEWLHEYCEPHMDARTLAQRLALTGTEVEDVALEPLPDDIHPAAASSTSAASGAKPHPPPVILGLYQRAPPREKPKHAQPKAA